MDEESTGWTKATPYIVIAAYVVGPLVLIPLGSVALVIAFIFATAAIAGLIDGYTHPFTWSLPFFTGAGFAIAKILYFNDRTFIYAFGCFLLTAAAAGIGAALSPKAPARPEEA